MEWRQRNLRKTILWDKRTNTARFYTAPDTRQYRAFADQFDVKNKTAERERVRYDAYVDWDANVVTDDEADGTNDRGGATYDYGTVAAHTTERRQPNEENLSDLVRKAPGFKVCPEAIIEEEDLEKLSCQDPCT
jgi:hypothetical protein